MAKRKCYGYKVGPDGELTVNPDEAQVVCWMFEQYLVGNSLGKIAVGLEKQSIPSPTGRPKWNREAIDKLLSNENILKGCCSRKRPAPALPKLKMMASWIGLYTDAHEAIISDEILIAVQQEKPIRSKEPQNHVAMRLSF